MNINARKFNKMLASRIQQYTEKLSGIYSKGEKLFQYSKRKHTNRLKNKNHMITSINTEKII